MKLVFRIHAIKRMFQRGITEAVVYEALKKGEIIEDYPKDFPYPSRLVLGLVHGRAIHVVVADNQEAGELIIITVYEPDKKQWEAGFRRRKK